MSIRILLLLSILSGYVTAQVDIHKYIDEETVVASWKADSLFNLGEYQKAMVYYTAVEPKHHFDLGWPIKKSLCYYLVGETTAAEKYFSEYALNGGYYMYVDQIREIPLYDSIAKNELARKQFKENTFAFEHSDANCLYPKVLEELMHMRTKDQAYRQGNGDPAISLTTIDSLNRIKLDSLINIYGWLGYKEVGKSGENASFLIAQHSDRNVAFQQRCLKAMEAELEAGNIYPPNFALIYDRVKTNTDKTQFFGSQLVLNTAGNCFVPEGDVELKHLNAYRLFIGLNTIEDYITYMNKRNGL